MPCETIVCIVDCLPAGSAINKKKTVCTLNFLSPTSAGETKLSPSPEAA